MGLPWAGSSHNPPPQTSYCTFSTPATISTAQSLCGVEFLCLKSSQLPRTAILTSQGLSASTLDTSQLGLNSRSHFLAVLSASPCDIASHLPLPLLQSLLLLPHWLLMMPNSFLLQGLKVCLYLSLEFFSSEIYAQWHQFSLSSNVTSERS